eukprot:621850-Pelagomonas_calceolata.AAC.1
MSISAPSTLRNVWLNDNLNDKLNVHMHKKHKLGSADSSGYHYSSWQRLNYATQTTSPVTTANIEAHNPNCQLAHKEVKALSRGRFGSSLTGMDACRNGRLLDQGIQVPENISRAVPDCLFSNGTRSSARHQSRPDAIFVRSISGRQAQFNPSRSLLKTGIHLVELKFCPDTVGDQPLHHYRNCNSSACSYYNQTQIPRRKEKSTPGMRPHALRKGSLTRSV